MSVFKYRCELLLLATIVLNGCSSLGSNSETSLQTQMQHSNASQEENLPADTSPQNAAMTNSDVGQGVFESVADPMAKIVLPSELKNGYSQAEKLNARKNFNEAINHLKMLQQAYPDFSGPSYRIAHLYFQMQQYDQALIAVDQAISIQPENYYAHNLKGLVLREQGNFTKAKSSYFAAIEHYPAYIAAHLNIAILADLYLYDLTLALKHYQRYAQLLEAKGLLTENPDVNGWILDLSHRMKGDAQ